ncbi:diacylglycerol kinase eta-like, partial [Python bivittatus]|uniref:Diacylglycerol kinase eta-like n=1 Tax=Python bivittatus TaxID=176946 RepID=A0A9F3QVF0_PYTBI
PCATLNEKLDSLVRELNEESQATVVPEGSPPAPDAKESPFRPSPRPPRVFKSKEQLMLRANSLKKALRQIIEQAEKAVDEQNKQTQSYRSLSVAGKRDSSEDFAKETDAPKPRRDTVISTTSSLLLDRPESFTTAPFAEDPDAVQFSERCVMNNYFGIGLDAKISLEFNNRRDEHPKKCSSRTKNMMWYGVLGTKELLQRTYKNLEQRVQLECDGVPISLPSLQGIAVLNIPSYAGGINFWGGTKEDNNFGAPSFDDKKLEVVAVFGSIQMAVSRVINLQHHRIAQCRVVKITIRGDEGVPVQVDGEAWIQPPGMIKIQHKNRAQMLTRDRAFESTLKSWEDKQKGEGYRAPSRPRLSSQQSMEYLVEEEGAQMQQLVQATETLISRIREAAKACKAMEQELAHAVNSSSLALSEASSCKSNSGAPEQVSRSMAMEVSVSVKALYTETRAFLEGRQLDSPQQEEALRQALDVVSQELRKFSDIHWMAPISNSVEEVTSQEAPVSSNKGSLKLRINLAKPKKEKEKLQKQRSGGITPVDSWGPEEVAAWLEALDLGEYKELFVRHDIQGSELILLERRDLKELGISKVGHLKRILQGIKDSTSPP